ncbi:MAG: DUF4258 domain-containing protein [Deltaproteobacteria bacterium]|nr:DUF4258 domain-containing protein [Deltaproteobacteria bacterium]
MVCFDQHALFQMERRGILSEWVERAPRVPDETEIRGDKRSFLVRLEGHTEMLRVVTRIDDPEYVITTYFDRRKPFA